MARSSEREPPAHELEWTHEQKINRSDKNVNYDPNDESGGMLIQVIYRIKKPTRGNPNAMVQRTDYFESETMPDEKKIAKELAELSKDFLPGTIRISEWKNKTVDSARESGLTVTKI